MSERTMQEIENLTKDFADKRKALVDKVQILEAAIQRLKDTYRREITAMVSEASEAYSRLELAVEDSPGLFKRPKTHVLHGIKVGYRKEPGKVCFENGDQVVRLIRKHLEDQADTLIKTTETPVKGALQQLSGAELKKIGVTITDASDAVLIKTADSEIDKWIDALMADDKSAELPAKAVA